MSRKVNSLQSNLPHRSPESASASSSGMPLGPSTTTSTTSFSGDEWLFLSDVETNQHKSWTLGDVVVDYQTASDLLHL